MKSPPKPFSRLEKISEVLSRWRRSWRGVLHVASKHCRDLQGKLLVLQSNAHSDAVCLEQMYLNLLSESSALIVSANSVEKRLSNVATSTVAEQQI